MHPKCQRVSLLKKTKVLFFLSLGLVMQRQFLSALLQDIQKNFSSDLILVFENPLLYDFSYFNYNIANDYNNTKGKI